MLVTLAIIHQAEPKRILDGWKNAVAFMFSDEDIEVHLTERTQQNCNFIHPGMHS
jgi:hypothetical protein